MSDVKIADINSLRRGVAGRVGGAKPKPMEIDTAALDAMQSEDFVRQVAGCVPEGVGFSVSKLMRAVKAEYEKNAELRACEPKSLMGAVMQCAELALVPGYSGHVHLAARSRSAGGGNGGGGFEYEANVIIGYKGLIALAMRSGEVVSVSSRIVYSKEIETEMFDLTYEGEKDTLLHKPILTGDRGSPELAYCLVRFKGGGFYVEPMARDEIEAIRDDAIERYRGEATQNAWLTHESEMWRKPPIRRAMKYLSLDGEGLSSALQLEDSAMQNRSQNLRLKIAADFVSKAWGEGEAGGERGAGDGAAVGGEQAGNVG